jgi:serine/threonine protein phosphatase PrpC
VNLILRAWASSDAGKVRRHNQDSFLIDPPLGLFAVADGMGGGARGEVASALACSAVQEAIRELRREVDAMGLEPSLPDLKRLSKWLEFAVLRGCKEVFDASTALVGESGRMGTTIDVIWSVGKHVFTAHVGDSRIYRIRNGVAEQLTQDHTMIAEKIRLGLLTPEQAATASRQSVITRSLGVHAKVQVDLAHYMVAPGDRFLLCSDGLYRDLTSEIFAQILKSTHGATGAEILVSMANGKGGGDNITALVIEVLEGDAESIAPHGFAPHVRTLRACELFSYCTWNELARVADCCRAKDLPPQSWVFKEGQPGQECYIIDKGHVEVIKDNKVAYRLGPGRVFGELSFIDLPRRTASVRTIEPTRLLTLSRRDFLQLIRQDASLASKVQWQMLRQLARVLRKPNPR